MGPGAHEWPAQGPAGPLPHLEDTVFHLGSILCHCHLHQTCTVVPGSRTLAPNSSHFPLPAAPRFASSSSTHQEPALTTKDIICPPVTQRRGRTISTAMEAQDRNVELKLITPAAERSHQAMLVLPQEGRWFSLVLTHVYPLSHQRKSPPGASPKSTLSTLFVPGTANFSQPP